MKKGFTLVELLAVIVIIALLATIAVPSAINISNSIKKDMYCEKIDMILTSAESWGNSHLKQLKQDGSCYLNKTLADLVEEGIVKKENEKTSPTGYISNPYTNETMDDINIGIYYKNSRAYAFLVKDNHVYEDLVDACSESELRICASGESERQGGEIVCVKRPTVKCP